MAEFEILPSPSETDKREKKQTGKKTDIKKLLKKKPFLIAVGVVALLGLYAWYKNSMSGGSSSDLVVASGYAGYPETGGAYTEASTAYEDEFYSAMLDSMNEKLSNIQNSYTSQLENMQTVYDNNTENLTSQVNSLSEKWNTAEDVLLTQSAEIQRQQDISTMMSNSDRALYSTSQTEKTALHNANTAIASKYGWIFGDDGYWYDETGKNRVYQTVTQSSKSSGGSSSGSSSKSSSGSSSASNRNNKNTSSGGITTVGGVSTTASTSASTVIKAMQANSQAYNNTSSSTQKSALHQANKNMASKMGWSYNSSTGTYHDKSGKRVY